MRCGSSWAATTYRASANPLARWYNSTVRWQRGLTTDMLRPALIFFVVWVLGALVRLVMRRSLGARVGRGASGPWGQNPWGQGRGQPSNHSAQTRSPYDVLGVGPGASREEIRAAYRRLVQQYHPDRVANLAPEFRELAEQRMKEINAAYQQLKT